MRSTNTRKFFHRNRNLSTDYFIEIWKVPTPLHQDHPRRVHRRQAGRPLAPDTLLRGEPKTGPSVVVTPGDKTRGSSMANPTSVARSGSPVRALHLTTSMAATLSSVRLPTSTADRGENRDPRPRTAVSTRPSSPGPVQKVESGTASTAHGSGMLIETMTRYRRADF